MAKNHLADTMRASTTPMVFMQNFSPFENLDNWNSAYRQGLSQGYIIWGKMGRTSFWQNNAQNIAKHGKMSQNATAKHENYQNIAQIFSILIKFNHSRLFWAFLGLSVPFCSSKASSSSRLTASIRNTPLQCRQNWRSTDQIADSRPNLGHLGVGVMPHRP